MTYLTAWLVTARYESPVHPWTCQAMITCCSLLCLPSGDVCLVSPGKRVTSSTPVSWPLENIKLVNKQPFQEKSLNLLDGGCTLLPPNTNLTLSLLDKNRPGAATFWIKDVYLAVANGTPITDGRMTLRLKNEVCAVQGPTHSAAACWQGSEQSGGLFQSRCTELRPRGLWQVARGELRAMPLGLLGALAQAQVGNK